MKSAKKQRTSARKSTLSPGPACPGCSMIKNQWPGEGYTHEGETYCCQGCAEGGECRCKSVRSAGFSTEGQKATAAQPRPGLQYGGAPAPKGELSGERDNLGTEEAVDQSGVPHPL